MMHYSRKCPILPVIMIKTAVCFYYNISKSDKFYKKKGLRPKCRGPFSRLQIIPEGTTAVAAAAAVFQ